MGCKEGETLVVITADHQTGGLTLLDGDIEKASKVHFLPVDTQELWCLYAFGPGAKEFTGMYENNELFHIIKKLLKL